MAEPPRLAVLQGGGATSTARELAERDDDELMLLARGGQNKAFETLVHRHQPRVLGLAFKFWGDEETARGIAHEAFVDLLRAVPTYRAQGKFHQFLLRIALNRCRMARRARTTRQRAHAEIASEPRPVAHEDILAREQQRDLARSLMRLRQAQRELLVLRFYEDLSHEELASVLGIPVGTVKSRLHAALVELREAMEEPE